MKNKDELVTLTKYNNRKFYRSGEKKGFYNLSEIAELVKEGNNVIVKDSEGNDLSKQTLQACISKLNYTENELLTIVRIGTLMKGI